MPGLSPGSVIPAMALMPRAVIALTWHHWFLVEQQSPRSSLA
jgi:hypothetical protein